MRSRLPSSYILLSVLMPALALAPVIMSSCRRSAHVEWSDTAVADTIPADTPVMEPPAADTVPPVLTDTDEILRAMARTPDSARYFSGILPQMARDVPEYAGRLLADAAEGFLIVDKNTMKLYRYDRFGVECERVGVAVAKPYGSKHKRRDNRTPEGYFTIEGIYDSTDWLYTDDDGNTSQQKGQFGPRFMRLRTPVSSQIGIHGTVAPWSIGGRRSHGCIRMTNENILRFAEICKPGWPVIVSPGPKDMQVNEEEGYDIPSVAVVPGKARCRPLPAAQKSGTAPTEASTDSVASAMPDSVAATPAAPHHDAGSGSAPDSDIATDSISSLPTIN